MNTNNKSNSLSKRMIVYLIITGVFIASCVAIIVLHAVGIIVDDLFQILFDVVVVALLIMVAVISIALGRKNGKSTKNKLLSTQNITRIAIMTALSYVLYQFIKFPLPFFPTFLELHISEVPALICGFAMGPVAGSLVIIFKVLLKLPFSTTVMVGELADLIMGLALVIPASLIYKHFHNKKGAIIGIIVGALTSTAAATILNIYMLIPWYVSLYFGGNWDTLISMLSSLYPDISISNFNTTYVLFGVIPFNLIRGLLNGVITFLIYKSMRKFFDKLVPTDTKIVAQNEEK